MANMARLVYGSPGSKGLTAKPLLSGKPRGQGYLESLYVELGCEKVQFWKPRSIMYRYRWLLRPFSLSFI